MPRDDVPRGPIRKGARPRFSAHQADRLYQLLVRCVDQGVCCPTAGEVYDYLRLDRSSDVSPLFAALVARGQIANRNAGFGRVVTIVESGRSTPERTTKDRLGYPGCALDRRPRACLACGRTFMSEHRFNRLCGCLQNEGIFA